MLSIYSPSDTLQYLSQLEMVARKLKDQLMRQKQVAKRAVIVIVTIMFQGEMRHERSPGYRPPQEESDC